jgi:transcriptional regulator with XRE-family HTH domain
MPPHLPGIAPLDWPALVAEALRRRKAEKLTQRQHAALAGVSVPTIVSFDRGELTLSLAKALDILRVVGLAEERSKESAQGCFVRNAFARWQELTAKLPAGSPARFPHGWHRFDYVLEGDLKPIELHELALVLERATIRHAGWPMFLISHRPDLSPQEIDGVLECWLGAGVDRMFYDAAHCDFWRAAPSGRMFLIRGYQEDAQETFPPGSIFDSTLVIWRLGEALLHAAKLANLLRLHEEDKIEIRFRAYYSGLSGRVLKAWANPLAELLVEGSPARSDEAILEAVIPAAEVETDLAAHIFPRVASLFERFGVTGLSPNRVQHEIERLQKSRSSI